jgi:hypothetical protein
MKVAVEHGKVNLYSERQFGNALEAIWGRNLRSLTSADFSTDNYFKFDHVVAAWINGAGCGWIAVPHFVMNGQLLEL